MPKIVDHDTRRREISETVARLIATDMLENVTINSISTACGTSPGMVLYYYDNKEKLLLSALSWCEAQHRGRIDKLTAGRRGIQALYYRLLSALPLNERIAREWKISMQFWSHLDANPAIAEYYDNRRWESYAHGVDDLKQAAALGELRPGLDLEWTMRSLIAVVTGIGVSTVYNARQFPAQVQARMLRQAFDPIATVAIEN